MPPKRNPPSIEESIAVMSENISKLTASTNRNNDKILANQAASSLQLENLEKQLENLVKQLATQNEQTANLIATLTQPLQRTTQMPPPTAPPPNRDLQIRPPKLNLPAFDGTNPLDWLFQADQYFSFYNITPPQRLALEAFTRALETRFGPSSYDNHQAALFKLKQTSTVTAYQTEFERLCNCVVGLPPEALLNCFISGLRQDIQQELSILRPHTITQAIGLAKLIEDKSNDQVSTPSSSTLLEAPSRSSETLPIKRLGPTDMQKRRVEGLSYNCPEKYHPGHKCNPPKFLLLQSEHEHKPVTIDPPWGISTVEYYDNTLLEGHFIITLEGSLLGDCDVEKTVGGHIHMRLEAKSSERDNGSGNDRSITGYELMIQGCAVSWEAILQHITILLSIEVVYMALTEVVKETIWLKGLWREIEAKLMLVAVATTGALKKAVPNPRFQHTMKLLCVQIKKKLDHGGVLVFRFPFPGRLIEIIVVSNKDCVYSIQFVYLDNNNNKQYSPKYGGDGPVDAKTNIIIIPEGEKIAGISGTVGPYVGFIVITSLYFIVGTLNVQKC
uniref:Uncharacterized protein n=1 Tax=Tanacetum cinerariifolium TaxID=118510 RepID=A0A699GLF7_TANCI|nr:hypothetical protein [Tanacetum cinerariifolium]